MATNNSEFLKFAAEYLYKTLPQLTVYSEDAQTVIQEQILQCIEAYRGLSMTLQNHPQDGGNESKGAKFLMFVLEGTIPITYQGGHYNIPVNVRLAGGYPLNPPVGYVKSSRELQLKQDHAHVDSLGFCHIKGFVAGQWDGSRTLKDFVDEMVRVFSADPPLYSKPAPLAPSAPTSDMHATKAHAGNPADSAVVTLKDEGVPIRRKTKSGAKKRPHGQQQLHHQQQQPVPNPPFPSQTKSTAKSVLLSEQPPSAPPAGGGTGEGREKVLGPERPISETGSDVSALSTQLSSLSTDDHKRGDAVKNVVADLQDGKISTDRAAKVSSFLSVNTQIFLS
ncbi:hypothetical protein CBR_g70686 [Chara braunii]|uniref:UEV domain-containing protein n=1 Tax=Chara braunii TaxID=69332 RepID=A0A388K9V4_CHABU|nr:hypothetical protein CBR_g70686 [Chara braunii]|eukprot:GBG66807.1 hypothetical protein CBR_g70686 [Chara braunii]